MDSFILVPQKGRQDEDSKNRQLVRAHVARRYWQGVKGSSSYFLQEIGKRPRKKFCQSRKGPSKESPMVTDASSKPENPCEAPCPPIGCSSDTFTYAGVYIEPGSYRFFQHYAAEFKVVLCNPVQPFYIDGSPICCTTAIHNNSLALLHAICFQAAAHEAVANANPSLRSMMFQDLQSARGLERSALYHKAKALSDLRRLFESRGSQQVATESSILCVAILLCAEAMMGDMTGLRSHAYGLRQLVGVYGGLTALSAPVISVVQLADLKAAMVEGVDPQFDKHTLRRKADSREHLESVSAMSDVATNRTGFGLLQSSTQLQLHSLLNACIFDARHLTLSLLRASRHTGLVSATIDDFIALEHALALLRNDCNLGDLEQCICLTLLLFVNTALWQIPLFFNWIRRLTADLKDMIRRLEWSEMTDQYPTLMLWIVFMGRYAGCAGPAAESQWWSRMIRKIAMRAGIATFHTAKLRFQDFFYVEDIYGRVWQRIWDYDMCSSTLHHGVDLVEAELASLTMKNHLCDL